MGRGGKAANRRKDHGLNRVVGKTGSHRNDGKGFNRIGITDRENPELRRPIAVSTTATHGPACDNGHPMKLEFGGIRQGRRSMFWVCNRPRCKMAIAYKPLRTGLKQTA